MTAIDLGKALLEALPVIVGGILVALVAVPIAFRQFRSERMWDKKQEAYSRILESLFAVQIYFDAQRESLEENQQSSSSVDERLGKDLTTGQAEVRKQASVGAFFISERAVKVLREVMSVLDDPFHGDILDEAKAISKAIDRALPELRAEAKRDLGLLWRMSKAGRATSVLLKEAEARRKVVNKKRT